MLLAFYLEHCWVLQLVVKLVVREPIHFNIGLVGVIWGEELIWSYKLLMPLNLSRNTDEKHRENIHVVNWQMCMAALSCISNISNQATGNLSQFILLIGKLYLMYSLHKPAVKLTWSNFDDWGSVTWRRAEPMLALSVWVLLLLNLPSQTMILCQRVWGNDNNKYLIKIKHHVIFQHKRYNESGCCESVSLNRFLNIEKLTFN